ncbi:MAG: phosphomannomutase [Campylobacterales bacterium]|nr:phosphomannomutase [Campylobacterales bacterium]
MILTIADTQLDTSLITKLYPVAIVGTGEENETTHISLEWLETEGVGKVMVAGYAIVVNLQDGVKKEFFYHTKDELTKEIISIQEQFASK